MKNYIKNFSQFQKLNELEFLFPDLMGIDAEVLSSIASDRDKDDVDFDKNNWWLSKSTEGIESLMKSMFGDDNVDEYKLVSIHGGEEMKIMDTPGGLYGSCHGKKYPLKSIQDGKVKIVDAGNNAIDNEDYEKNQMDHSKEDGVHLDNAYAMAIVFEDNTRIVQINLNNGGWGSQLITVGLASSIRKETLKTGQTPAAWSKK